MIFAAGLLVAAAFAWSLPAELSITYEGEKTVGTVVSVAEDPSVTHNDYPTTKVVFSYAVAGVTHEGSFHDRDGRYARLEKGASVPLEVSRRYPGWSRIEGQTYGSFGYVGAYVLAVPAIGLVLAILGGLGVAIRRLARLLAR